MLYTKAIGQTINSFAFTVILESNLGDIITLYGSTVSFTCTVNDPDVNITWNTTATIATLPSPVLVDMGNTSVLILTDVTLDNQGDYSCVVIDEFNITDVSTATLSVRGTVIAWYINAMIFSLH